MVLMGLVFLGRNRERYIPKVRSFSLLARYVYDDVHSFSRSIGPVHSTFSRVGWSEFDVFTYIDSCFVPAVISATSTYENHGMPVREHLMDFMIYIPTTNLPLDVV
jgi:hypothetical protein